ncbi:MAG: hypothetical protein IPG99_09215 [Ignavibacteria bacterium]|nr:hypothetical protein [Ignavibacteria bacterium]
MFQFKVKSFNFFSARQTGYLQPKFVCFSNTSFKKFQYVSITEFVKNYSMQMAELIEFSYVLRQQVKNIP